MSRLRALALAATITLGVPALAAADTAPAPAPAAPAPAPAPGEDWSNRPFDPDAPIRIEGKPEILHEKPSGFWTTSRRRGPGAYRYRLLLVGVAVAALMAVSVVFGLRRVKRAV